jgi:2-oxoglutarate dehydrogenase E2 component (dihydrolipoamide succinyltransferase)
LGIAVDLDFQGLMVPVVRGAQDLRIEALATRTADLASRARARQLGHDDLTGSTFTITNPGGYGTLAGTPLVNPPEVAILCVEGISEDPVVVTTADGSKSIAIHHVGHLSLSWDHRAIDGAYAAAFLAKIRSELETRDWAALLRP